MRSVVDQKVVMRRMSVFIVYTVKRSKNLRKKSVNHSSLCAEFEKHQLVTVKYNIYLIHRT
jgi:hypothetical protein